MFQPVGRDLEGQEEGVGHREDDGHDRAVKEIDVQAEYVGQHPRISRRPGWKKLFNISSVATSEKTGKSQTERFIALLQW